MTTLKSPSIKGLRLAQKLGILICLVFIIGMMTSSYFVKFMINNKTQQEISFKAMILIEAMNSVRDYTDQRIKPLINQAGKEFAPEIVPAFSSRTVFENFRKNPLYQDFLYREAALNPTNINDQANEAEAKIIEQFRANLQLKEKTGFLTNPNQSKGDFFYIAHPLAVTQRSCLQCHSTPASAPPEMVAKYGSEGGFNWQLHEVIGTQIVYVPVQKILSATRQLFFTIILTTFIFFGITITIIYYWLQRQVLKPITKIAHTVEDISMGDLSKKLDSKRRDEIGVMAQSIDRLVTSLQMAMQRISKLSK